MSSHQHCPECGCATFWLRADGAIVCAVDDCRAVFGRWSRGAVA